MKSLILVINSGSSSIKYRLFDGTRVLTSGLIERIGETLGPDSVPTHRVALDLMAQRLEATGYLKDLGDLAGVGHRVVHGGETFRSAALIDERVVRAIQAATPLAPLHNPANLMGIEACRARWPEIPNVAVFDTAFHQTMPPEAFRYALPEACYETAKIRKYGFHGTSFSYVTQEVADYLGKPRSTLNLILLHLGNGASACAVRNGISIDTSMGMTPLAGLVMGTRCGDLDPGAVLHLLRLGYTAESLEQLLNRESGLKGLCGLNDWREIAATAAQGNERAELAMAQFAYRIKGYIGAFAAHLERVDALVFTGGIGEHHAPIRLRICEGLKLLGIEVDATANAQVCQGVAEIQTESAQVKVLVVPTNEELEIVRQTLAILSTQSLV